MEVLLLLAMILMGITNIMCFVIGAKVGQTVSKGKDIEVPTINPKQIMQERENRREADRVQDRIETIMENIKNYDGTGAGQKDVPR